MYSNSRVYLKLGACYWMLTWNDSQPDSFVLMKLNDSWGRKNETKISSLMLSKPSKNIFNLWLSLILTEEAINTIIHFDSFALVQQQHGAFNDFTSFFRLHFLLCFLIQNWVTWFKINVMKIISFLSKISIEVPTRHRN